MSKNDRRGSTTLDLLESNLILRIYKIIGGRPTFRYILIHTYVGRNAYLFIIGTCTV